jgi:hypothetical protein
VRTEMSATKKSLVLSLLVIYLLIAVACIFYLPKYNPLRFVNNYKRVNTHLVYNPTKHTEHGAANVLVLLNRTYRSTIENKRDTLNTLVQTGLALISFIIGGIGLIVLLQKAGYLKLFRSQQYVYLSYCTLRI